MDGEARQGHERAAEEAPSGLAYKLERIPGTRCGWAGPDGRRFAFLSIPMPPSMNNLWINLKGGGRARSEGYKAWVVEACWAIKLAAPCKFAGSVRIDMRFERTNMVSDLDNRIKPILDALQKMEVVENDRQVIDLRARWWLTQGCRIKIEDANAKARTHAGETIPTAVELVDDRDDPSAFLDG